MKEGYKGYAFFLFAGVLLSLFLLRLLVMKEYAENFYKSKQWQTVRETAIRRDRYLCVDCLRRDMVTPAEEVHHIVELTPDNINDPNITLNLDNLVSLCRECHKARHGNRDPKRYKVDEMGNVVIR